MYVSMYVSVYVSMYVSMCLCSLLIYRYYENIYIVYIIYIYIYIHGCTTKLVVGHSTCNSIVYVSFQLGQKVSLMLGQYFRETQKITPPSHPNRTSVRLAFVQVSYGCFQKKGYPQIINFNRVFHYFHHPFWGIPICGNTHIFATCFVTMWTCSKKCKKLHPSNSSRLPYHDAHTWPGHQNGDMFQPWQDDIPSLKLT